MVAGRHLGWSLVASLMLHVTLLAVVSTWGAARALGDSPYVDRPDWWAGSTVEIDEVVGAAAAGSPAPEEEAQGLAATQNDEPKAEPDELTEPTAAEPEPDPAPEPPPAPDPYGESWLPEPIDDEADDPPNDPPTPKPADEASEEDSTSNADATNPAPTQDRPALPPAVPVATGSTTDRDAGAEHGGSFGSQGAPTGVRNLAKAFTRALPIAGYHDSVWKDLPAGVVGTATVTIRVDGDGKIAETDVDDEAPSALRELFRKTFLHLKIGKFALARGDVTAGTERLDVDVTLSNRPALEPGTGVQIGFEAPKPGSPGRGYFTLVSGRHFDATVTIEASDPAPAAD